MSRVNKAAERFVMALRASIGKWKMPAETEAFYISALSKWYLPESVWTRTLSLIVAQNTEGELPPLARIYDYLRQQQREIGPNNGVNWLLFDYRGFCYAKKMLDPANPPSAPPEASRIRLAIEKPITDAEVDAAHDREKEWGREGDLQPIKGILPRQEEVPF